MEEKVRIPIWRRPEVLDWALPLVLVLPAWLMLWGYPRLVASGEMPIPVAVSDAVSTVTWASYLLVGAVFLPLVVRRRFPLTVLASTTILAALYVVAASPRAPVQLAPIAALFTVGTLRDRRTVWIAYSVATVFTLMTTVHPFVGYAWIPDAVSTVTAFGVAAALGDATRSRRAYVAAIEQRALDAERTREDEARRRVEEERLRIARELHDVTAHSLSIIALQAGAAEKAVRRDPDAAILALQTIRATSRDSLDELRAMLGVLRSADEDAPLSPAGRLERLPELVGSVERAGLHVNLQIAADLGDIPAYADVSAYRIAQEAITNVVRHANAHNVSVRVAREADRLVIEVVDDGRGTTDDVSAEGHGIAGMRERVAALGGTFDAGSLPGTGFRVYASLPLARKGATA